MKLRDAQEASPGMEWKCVGTWSKTYIALVQCSAELRIFWAVGVQFEAF